MAARTGLTLIVCGTACLLAAVALQGYVAHLSAANKSQVNQLVSQRGGAVFGLDWDSPASVLLMTVVAAAAGGGLAGVGVLLSLRRERPARPSGRDTQGVAASPGGRTVLQHLPAGHKHMPETWFLEQDAVTGATFLGHTYWRVEEGGLTEGEWTDRWALEEAKGRVPDDVWRRASEAASHRTDPAPLK